MIEPTDLVVDGEPTAEERVAIEQAWERGELPPPPWVIVEVPTGPSPTGKLIPPHTYVMLKAPAVWAEHYAAEMNLGHEVKPADGD